MFTVKGSRSRRALGLPHGNRGILVLAVVLVAILAALAAVPASPRASSGSAAATARVTTVADSRSTGAPSTPSPSLLTSGDPYSIVAKVSVGSVPWSAAYDSGKHELFVANSNADNVSVVSDSTTAVVATVTVGSGPDGAAYDSGKAEVFVAVSGTNSVAVISDATNAVVATIMVGSGPTGVAYDSQRGEVYVANYMDGTVSVISDASNAVVATVTVGTQPTGVAYDSGLGQVLVANMASNNVTRISDMSHASVGSESVGLAPFGVAYDPATAEAYVTDYNASAVSVVPDVAGGMISPITVGSHPAGIAYGAGQLFVANEAGDTMSIIADSNRTVVATVGLYVGGGPLGVAYDGGNHGVYVTEVSIDTVVVLAPGYPVTFTETGLPASTMWIVDFNGTNPFGRTTSSYSSTTSTVRVVAPNGTYSFGVRPVTGFGATPASGTVTVSGAALSRSITFAFLYSVTFTETGLPAGTSWTVTLAGVSKDSTTTTIAFQQGNGTYPFSSGGANGYDANPASGNVTVNGTAATRTIAFTVTPASSNLLPLVVGVIAAVVVVVAILVVLRMRRRRAPPSSGTPPEEPGIPPTP